MKTDPIIKQRIVHLDGLQRKLELLNKDIPLIKRIFENSNGTLSWFLNGELVVSVIVDKIKEITPLMKLISKTGKFKREHTCKQSSSLWIVYLHKKSGMEFIVEAVFSGGSCHYVDTGRVESKPILKLVCD
jgi:hypothetical protein